MNKHVPAKVSYKAARALAYLMTRKWWKELKDIYNSEEDGIRQESGLEIEDYILADANKFILSKLIFWPFDKIKVWSKRNDEFLKLWNNNFNSPEGTTEEKVDGRPLFKVGDKVRIKKRTENEDKYWGYFTDEMAKFAGKICTVVDVEKWEQIFGCESMDRTERRMHTLPDDGYFYSLKGFDSPRKGFDSPRWYWASSMLEKA